jgi:NitT/TauT family transport system ATP-binding protein
MLDFCLPFVIGDFVLMSHTPILTIRNLSAVFPDNNGGLRALEDVSFDVHPREFVCVLGPSGSGKTTLLRILAGLVPPTFGTFMFGHGEQPSIGMVFQQANLMPWRTVIENIKLPLEVENVDDIKARATAQEMIELVGLQGFGWHNAWRLHAPSSMTLTCSCSTNRLARWMP